MRFADVDLTEDGFLGGRLRILQPRTGYRAAMDPVLLAACVAAKPGEHVLELGCGAGVASLCLGWRVPGVVLTGLERQADYADLARRNAALNAGALTVVEGDVAAMPAELRAQTFQHVMANPPYFTPASGTAAQDAGREAAQREDTPLAIWIAAGLRRLAPGGRFWLIQAADRLPDLLAALADRAGAVTVLPLVPRAGRPAARVLVRARKGAGGPFVLLAPVILHNGPVHPGDTGDLADAVRAVLHDGAALPFSA